MVESIYLYLLPTKWLVINWVNFFNHEHLKDTLKDKDQNDKLKLVIDVDQTWFFGFHESIQHYNTQNEGILTMGQKLTARF
jgi:hypothetical protein